MAIKKFKSNKGFSILEGLIAMLIFTIGILGIVTMQIYATRTNSFSDDMTKSIEAASDVIERLMFINYSDTLLNDDGNSENITDIPGFNANTYSGLSGTFKVDDINKSALGNTKEITVKISWQNNKHNLEFKFIRTQDDSL